MTEPADAPLARSGICPLCGERFREGERVRNARRLSDHLPECPRRRDVFDGYPADEGPP